MKFKNRLEDPIPEEIRSVLNHKPFHIAITGDIGTGKSTLAGKILKEISIDGGFITERIVGVKGIQSGVYIHRATGEEKSYSKKNLCALIDEHSEKGNCIITERFPEVFDTLGCAYLSGSGIFLMDEIGFLERDSKLFLKRINEIFESSNSFIAVIKKKDIDYLNTLKSKPGTFLYSTD